MDSNLKKEMNKNTPQSTKRDYISLQTIENTTTQIQTTKYTDRNSVPDLGQAPRRVDVKPINEITTLPGACKFEANKRMSCFHQVMR